MATYVTSSKLGHEFQRRVPRDVLDVIGKPVVRKWLGDTSRADALAKAKKLATQTDALILTARTLSPDDRQAVLAHPGRLEGWLHVQRVALACLTTTTQTPGPAYDPDADDATQAAQVLLDMRSKKMAQEIADKLTVSSAPVYPMRELTDLWIERRAPSSKSSIDATRLAVTRWENFAGASLSLAQITPKLVNEFVAQMTKDGRSATTTNKALDHLRTLFNVAIATGLLRSNPGQGVRVMKPKAKRSDGRKAFDGTQIKLILEKSKAVSRDFTMVMKLLVWHGARSGEIVQLRKRDIATVAGVPCIRINDEGGKSVKNRDSVRDIPIHANCMDVLTYCQAADDDAPLFPTLTVSGFQVAASKFIRAHISSDTGLVSHSLRHSWKSAARECEMPLEVARAIQGHALGDDVASGYGGVSMALKTKWMAVVDPLSL